MRHYCIYFPYFAHTGRPAESDTGTRFKPTVGRATDCKVFSTSSLGSNKRNARVSSPSVSEEALLEHKQVKGTPGPLHIRAKTDASGERDAE